MSKAPPDRSTLGGTIQYLREHRGMSQEDLSNELRLRSDIIPSIEDGVCTPSENIIEGIAIADKNCTHCKTCYDRIHKHTDF